MNTISRVKMEYPFPANEWAQQAKLWKDDDDLDEVNYCVEVQKELTKTALNRFVDELDGAKISDMEIAVKSWELISVLSNLIRCMGIRSNFNGELFGLNVLFKILSED